MMLTFNDDLQRFQLDPLIKAHERVSWNSEGLEGYAVSNSDILQFRKVSQVKASAVIKGPTL